MSAAAPAPGAEPLQPASPALPDHGPRLLLAPPPADWRSARPADPSPELLRLAEAADSLLMDAGDLVQAGDPVPFGPAHLRRRVAAVGDLLRDSAEAVAAADAHIAAVRAEAARLAAHSEAEVARLWRTVSADVATRRAATDQFVAHAMARAEREANALLADASARAELVVARADELVASWLDEANAEVARLLGTSSPELDEGALPLAGDVVPRRRRLLARLFRRR